MDSPHHTTTNLFDLSNRLNRLIIFTRYPELGKNKTRLIPALEDAMLSPKTQARATEIHRRLAEHTLAQGRQWLTKQSAGKITACFTGGDAQSMAAWLGEDLDYHPQGEGDLGQRILFVLEHFRESNLTIESHRESYIKNYFVVIGTDCPDLTSEDIDRAFAELSENDLVLGPAEDGGYYLIGFTQIIPQLFQDISWGTATVFAETVAIAKNLDLRISYLPVRRDIDRPEDLNYLKTLAGFENI